MSEINTKVDEYDSQHGTYKDDVHEQPEDTKLPTGAMPKGPDPKPFNLTGGGAGSR
jgi:hypothetical protein